MRWIWQLCAALGRYDRRRNQSVVLHFMIQDVLLPHVYRHLIFRSKNSLQRAICAVLTDETQSEKLARWTRRMHLAHYEVDLPWSDGGTIIKYAQSLAELQISSKLSPVEIMAVGSASLRQLKLYLPQDAMLAIVPYIGSRFPNLRRLELDVSPLPKANVLSPMNEQEYCSIPHVETLQLGFGWLESSAPLCGYLSQCRFPSLRRLVMRAGTTGTATVPALKQFLDTQRALESCYFMADRAIMSLVLPRLSCRVLTVVPHFDGREFIRTRELLHPRVQVFRVVDVGNPDTLVLFWDVMDSLESGLSSVGNLVCVQLKQWISLPDRFRWDRTHVDLSDGEAALMIRMHGYARRLRERSILLLDCDARSEDGESHPTYDFEDHGDF
jgi:hypothetical protein